ncbi:hypothetical protein THJ096_18800 (plasmid) [Campylobacter jejuni]|nr:hypothetical protein THJ096_18800 [Campylobacter jejuni]
MNIAYIRVSTNKQELDSQKLEIMEYCHKNNIILDEILEVKISSTKSQEKRKIKDLKQKLKAGDLINSNRTFKTW